MDFIYKIVALLCEKLPVIKLTDGKKRWIGNSLIMLAAALAALQGQEPSLQGIDTTIAILGFLVKIVGEMHAVEKVKVEKDDEAKRLEELLDD